MVGGGRVRCAPSMHVLVMQWVGPRTTVGGAGVNVHIPVVP
jgi:hypothetical protein